MTSRFGWVFFGLSALSAAGAASAQDRLAPQAVAALPEAVHLSREAYLERVAAIAPHLRSRSLTALDLTDDPFLWRFEAAFGLPDAPGPDLRSRRPGGAVPAGLIHCARFGLATRDLLTAHAASDPAIFPVVATLRVETRDIEMWPEDAIAVLRCSFVWDDARRILPWTEAETAPMLEARFAQVTRRDDATVRARAGGHVRAQYGPEGFRLDADGAERGVHFWLESMSVTRQITHQRVAFRVYLLSGGV